MSTSVVRSWTEHFRNLSSSPLADLVRQLARRIDVLSRTQRLYALLEWVVLVLDAITEDGPIVVGYEHRSRDGSCDIWEVRLGREGFVNHEGRPLSVEEAGALEGFFPRDVEAALIRAIQRTLERLG